jgi:hypothetical protein
MSDAQIHDALGQLRNAASYADQIATLRTLKNEAVGHVAKKEKLVKFGTLEAIVGILVSNRPPAKLNGKDSRAAPGATRDLFEEEVAQLYALELLGAFAGGRSYLRYILEAYTELILSFRRPFFSRAPSRIERSGSPPSLPKPPRQPSAAGSCGSSSASSAFQSIRASRYF